MKKILVMMALMVAGAALLPVGVGAVNLNPICDEITDSEQRKAAGCDDTGGELIDGKGGGRVPTIVNAILWIAGVLAVGMIIYAAVRMVISQGDAGKVEQEKKTIMYAVTGLIVTLLAYVIVAFIAGQFKASGDVGSGDTATPEAPAEGGDATTPGGDAS